MKANIKIILLTSVLGATFVFAGYAALKDSESTEDLIQSVSDNPSSSSTAKKLNAANEARTRGHLLYTNHCVSCHESSVYIRGKRRATSLADVQYWVGRWAEEMDLKWSAKEIEDVADYLNKQYYQY